MLTDMDKVRRLLLCLVGELTAFVVRACLVYV
jgi:hypothetical protein